MSPSEFRKQEWNKQAKKREEFSKTSISYKQSSNYAVPGILVQCSISDWHPIGQEVSKTCAVTESNNNLLFAQQRMRIICLCSLIYIQSDLLAYSATDVNVLLEPRRSGAITNRTANSAYTCGDEEAVRYMSTGLVLRRQVSFSVCIAQLKKQSETLTR